MPCQLELEKKGKFFYSNDCRKQNLEHSNTINTQIAEFIKQRNNVFVNVKL